jgi:Rrf2 family nitric oxide-sensitive transcriptional repressor
MRLTNFSDYALRMLMYTASAGGCLITIEEAPRAFNVSKTHLKEVANTLTRGGYLKAIRGRSADLFSASCKLSRMFGDAIVSFQSTLGRYTLADITADPRRFPRRPDTTASHQGGRQRRIM